MKMKKWFSLFLAVLMCFSLLAGCGGNTSSAPAGDSSTPTDSAAPADSSTPASGDKADDTVYTLRIDDPNPPHRRSQHDAGPAGEMAA